MTCCVRVGLFISLQRRLWLLVLAAACALPSLAGARLAAPCKLEWSPVPTTDVAGYALYYGIVGSPVTNRLDVGAQSTATVYNLTASSNYFFFVVSYNVVGLESEPSNIVLHTPTALSPLRLKPTGDGGSMCLYFEAHPGTQCRVEYTDSLESPDWQPLGTWSAGTNGAVRIEGIDAASPARFYRAVAF